MTVHKGENLYQRAISSQAPKTRYGKSMEKVQRLDGYGS
jgi:hypothetical protein